MDGETLAIGVGAVALVGMTFMGGGGGTLSNMIGDSSSLKAIRDQGAVLGQTAQIAEDRYKNGCIVHVKRADIQRPEDVAIGAVTVEYVSISQGQTPVDFRSGMPYSAGAVVCDVNGNTGVVDADGTITSHAYTGNQDVVWAHVDNYFRGAK